MEEQFQSLRMEWNILKQKWFVGEQMDPVFEGTVRDFCQFDNTLQDIYRNVEVFMKGVEQLCEGVATLSESVVQGLGHYHDGHIATESCKLREASHQITRTDAPHSAIAKLRRDMDFNILNPMRTHLLNNRNLKTNLDVRRRRLLELTTAKKPFDALVQKHVPEQDPKFVRAKSHYESAKLAFQECDRQVFEWLYILEDYKGDILDSTLQTLKYLQYEFFASGAHSISASLPARMEFRPMVEMTPDHLEAQVELELKEQEEEEGGSDREKDPVTDFSVRLIEKMAKQSPPEPPLITVDPLSLASLVGQGFEEGPARRALRTNNNDTQLALDWLVNGGPEQKKVSTAEGDGVRLPTTIKRIQKLRARRKKIAAAKEKKRLEEKEIAEKQVAEEREKNKKKKKKKKAADSDNSPSESSDSTSGRQRTRKQPAPPADMDLIGLDDQAAAPTASPAGGASRTNDLLSLDDTPHPPTDFTKSMHVTDLPPQIPSFDPSNCITPGTSQTGTAVSSDTHDVLAMLQQGQQLSPQQLLLAQKLLAQQASAQQQQGVTPAVSSPIATAAPAGNASAALSLSTTGLDGLNIPATNASETSTAANAKQGIKNDAFEGLNDLF